MVKKTILAVSVLLATLSGAAYADPCSTALMLLQRAEAQLAAAQKANNPAAIAYWQMRVQLAQENVDSICHNP